jgi:2-haloacid dehalogenase
MDWSAFADAWRDQYQPSMEEVRSGTLPYTKLDVLHRRSLSVVLPRFGLRDLEEAMLDRLTQAWHRLDAWSDVSAGLERLRRRYVIAPVSNGNISIMSDLARRNDFHWDAILGADLARDFKPAPAGAAGIQRNRARHTGQYRRGFDIGSCGPIGRMT